MNTGELIRQSSVAGFTFLPNGIAQSKTLTLEQKGMLLTLFGLHPNFKIYKTTLSTIINGKPHATERVFSELQSLGYILSRKIKGEGGIFSGWEHIIFDHPQPIEDKKNDAEKSESPKGILTSVGQECPIISTKEKEVNTKVINSSKEEADSPNTAPLPNDLTSADIHSAPPLNMSAPNIEHRSFSPPIDNSVAVPTIPIPQDQKVKSPVQRKLFEKMRENGWNFHKRCEVLWKMKGPAFANSISLLRQEIDGYHEANGIEPSEENALGLLEIAFARTSKIYGMQKSFLPSNTSKNLLTIIAMWKAEKEAIEAKKPQPVVDRNVISMVPTYEEYNADQIRPVVWEEYNRLMVIYHGPNYLEQIRNQRALA